MKIRRLFQMENKMMRNCSSRSPHITARVIVLAAATALVMGSAALAADPIRLGAPIPLTGPFASDGLTMEKAIKLAVKDINDANGLLGQPIEIKTFDIGDLTPDKLQAAAANLIEREGVDALINGYGGMGPDIPAFCSYGVPYLHNDAVSSVISLAKTSGCSSVFNASDVDVNYGKTVFDQLQKVGYDFPTKRLAIVHGPFEWDINFSNGLAEAAKAAGWEVVFEEEVPYENLEWSGILSKIRDAKPSLVHLEALDPAVASTFTDQFRANPPKGALLNIGYVGSTPGVDDAIRQGTAESVLAFTLSAQVPGKIGDDFVSKWKAAYHEDPPVSLAAAIYDEVNLWAAAVKKVGNAKDYPAIAEAIKSMKFKGLTGTFTFNGDNYINTANDTQPTLLYQVQNKKRVLLMVGDQKQNDLVPPSWIK